MARVEREREKNLDNEPIQKQVILFVDDDVEILENSLARFYLPGSDLQVEFYNPNLQFSLSDQTIEDTQLIIVDQFYNTWDLQEKVSGILKMIRTQKPNVEIIETSYLPSESSIYEGTIGIFDTINLCNILGDRTLKTATALIEKIKWDSNYAFQEAKHFENTDMEDGHDDRALLRTFTRLLNSFSKLANDTNLPKLLDALSISNDDFKFAFMADNNLDRRKNLLHCAWQVVGHLIYKHDPETYSMPLQRLKGIVAKSLDFDNNW